MPHPVVVPGSHSACVSWHTWLRTPTSPPGRPQGPLTLRSAQSGPSSAGGEWQRCSPETSDITVVEDVLKPSPLAGKGLLRFLVTLSTYSMPPLCTQAVETPVAAEPVPHVQLAGKPDGAVGDEGELLLFWRGRLPQPHPSVWNDSAAVPEGHGHCVLQVCHPFT